MSHRPLLRSAIKAVGDFRIGDFDWQYLMLSHPKPTRAEAVFKLIPQNCQTLSFLTRSKIHFMIEKRFIKFSYGIPKC